MIKKDDYRGHKIIGGSILTGLATLAFAHCSGEKAIFPFVILLITGWQLVNAWTGKPFTKFLSKALEHPEHVNKQ